MKEKGISMPELGKGLKPRKNGVLEGDLGRAAVYGWLNGNGFPNVIQLGEICRKLDISSDYLVFGGIREASPQMARAAQAVKELSDEERLALFAVMQGQATADARVEEFIPPPPPDPLHSDFGALEALAEKSRKNKPHHPGAKLPAKSRKDG